MTWAVGQTVFVVENRNRLHTYEATITKIGRKWATLSGNRPQRFDMEDCRLDGEGYSSPGVVYRDKGVWEQQSRIDNLHQQLRSKLHCRRNPGVSEEDIRTAASLLRIPLEEPPCPR